MPKSKYTDEFKKEVGEATFEEGMSLAKVGEKYNVHPTLVRNWRLKYCKDMIPEEEKVILTESEPANLTDDDFKNNTDILKKFEEEINEVGEDIDNSCWDGNEDLFPEEHEIMYLNAYWNKETNQKKLTITMYSPLAERIEENGVKEIKNKENKVIGYTRSSPWKYTYSGHFDEAKFMKEIFWGQFGDRIRKTLKKYGLSEDKIEVSIDFKMPS